MKYRLLLWIILIGCGSGVEAQLRLREISGQVSDKHSGKLMDSVLVLVLNKKTVVARVFTDNEGKYTTGLLLVPDLYEVKAVYKEYCYATVEDVNMISYEHMFVQLGMERAEPLPPDPAYQTGVTEGEIRGQVVDSRTRVPLIYASVWIQSGDTTIAKTISNINGEYVIKSVPPGEYRLLAYCAKCEERAGIEKINVITGLVVFYNIRVKSNMDRKGVGYSDIQTSWPVDTVPAFLGWIKGTVVDADTRKPLQFVSVQIEQDGYVKAQVLTDTDGRYIFTNIPYGDYVVRTSYAEYKSTVIGIALYDKHIIKNNMRLEKGVGVVYKNPVVVQKPIPLIDPEGKSGRTYTSEELMRLPVRQD